MIEGRSSQVYFSADSSVFNDSAFPHQNIYYNDLQNIRGSYSNVIELKKGETVKAIIQYPTFFRLYDEFLIYPGEHILIKKGKYNDFTFEIKGNKKRNNELQLFKTFHQIEPYLFIPYVKDATLDTILFLEKKERIDYAVYKNIAKKAFDSLLNNNQVSIKFKKIANHYLDNRYSANSFFLYRMYKDTLVSHGLYKIKCKQLISKFNNIVEKPKFDNIVFSLNELADEILPYKIWRINNESEFQACFDTINSNFNFLAKDYLLSQLLYSAYKRRILVSESYINKYITECKDIDYKKLVQNVILQQERYDIKASKTSTNSLLAVNGRRIMSLESLLNKYNGKFIYIDFWASWCIPCIEELPHFKKILKDYSGNEIVFISISLDMEAQTWRKFVIANNLSTNINYLLLNTKKSSFVEQYDIHSIPRFMIFDKNGKILQDDAPRPSDINLKQLLDKILN